MFRNHQLGLGTMPMPAANSLFSHERREKEVLMATFVVSKVCSAFEDKGVGTRVLNREAFLAVLVQDMYLYSFPDGSVPGTAAGQGFIPLSRDAESLVSCGVGRRTKNPDDYVAREWRGQVSLFLRRELAPMPEHVSVVVYTVDAYLADPDVASDEAEVARVRKDKATHVIVAVLASVGPKPTLSPERFVHNLAGGNKAFLPRETAEENDKFLRELCSQAEAIKAYAEEWCTVAD